MERFNKRDSMTKRDKNHRIEIIKRSKTCVNMNTGRYGSKVFFDMHGVLGERVR